MVSTPLKFDKESLGAVYFIPWLKSEISFPKYLYSGPYKMEN